MTAHEPYVTSATVRDAGDELHIECRFSDGQKFAAVIVAVEFEGLAHSICEFLNSALRPTDNERTERERVAAAIARTLDEGCTDFRVVADAAIAALRPADSGLVERHERSFREGFREGWRYSQTQRLLASDAEDEAWKFYRSPKGENKAALRAQGQDERAGWQPIETAPRDGTEFIMFDANVNTATVGHWMTDVAWMGRSRPKPQWFPLANPTHWQQLPTPPDAIEAGQHRQALDRGAK